MVAPWLVLLCANGMLHYPGFPHRGTEDCEEGSKDPKIKGELAAKAQA